MSKQGRLAQGVEEDYAPAPKAHSCCDGWESAHEMYDLFWESAAQLGVPSGKYTPAQLVRAIYEAGQQDGISLVAEGRDA